jgi:hypothetical protein
VFDIWFNLDESAYVDEDGWPGLWGRIVLGEFAERFVAPIGSWSRSDYERQWIEGAKRLIDGAVESAFVEEAGRRWWTAWRVGVEVLIQQRLLVHQSMKPAWTATPEEIPYDLVGQRQTHSANGEPISEWTVTVADLEDFVARRAPPAG